MTKQKILILGDEEKAPYHPLSRVLPGIRNALSEMGQIDACTEYSNLKIEQLNQYTGIISYLDNYKQLEGFDDILAEYIIQGGKVLALHNGIITLERSRLEQAYGGNFITHPPYCLLEYHVENKKKNQWNCGKLFCMEEEPYMVQRFDEKSEVFMRFKYKETLYDAGWYREYYKGRVVYLAPGHDERTAQQDVFQKVLRGCMSYLIQ